MEKKLKFEIPGKIKGKQRPRFGNGVVYTSKDTSSYESWIKSCYLQHAKRIKGNDERSLKVTIEAVFPIPKSYTKKQRLEIKYPKRKIDIDNIEKCVLDALNGIAYKDDCQVVELAGFKKFGLDEKIIVTIEYLEGI